MNTASVVGIIGGGDTKTSGAGACAHASTSASVHYEPPGETFTT